MPIARSCNHGCENGMHTNKSGGFAASLHISHLQQLTRNPTQKNVIIHLTCCQCDEICSFRSLYTVLSRLTWPFFHTGGDGFDTPSREYILFHPALVFPQSKWHLQYLEVYIRHSSGKHIHKTSYMGVAANSSVLVASTCITKIMKWAQPPCGRIHSLAETSLQTCTAVLRITTL